MNQTKKSSVNVGNINQMIKEEFYKSKYVKIALYIGATVAGLFAIGFVLKSINYSLSNYKNLSDTLKR